MIAILRTKVLTTTIIALSVISLPLVAQNGVSAGLLVSRVDPESPAASAGIERGNLILGIDGQDLISARDLVKALAATKGSEVTLSIKHGDEIRDQVVVMDRVWGQPRIGVAIAGTSRIVDRKSQRGWTGPISPNRSRLQFFDKPDKFGVVVIQVAEDSVAAKIGLQVGDWITAFGGTALDGTAGQLVEIVSSYEPGDEASIDYHHHEEEITGTVILGENPETGEAMLGIRYKPLSSMKYMGKRSDKIKDPFERQWRGNGRKDPYKNKYPNKAESSKMNADNYL